MTDVTIAMSDSNDLDALQEKIDEARTHASNKKSDASGDAPVNLGYAMRFTVELLSGIAAGGAIGYFIDRWLHTFPWLFIIGFFLGAAAGFRNLLREANKE